MKTLALLRHGKSSWADPALRDFDRPLKRRGRVASTLMGKHLRRRGITFDVAIASPARRVVETMAHLETGLGKPLRVHFVEDIYDASSEVLLEILRTVEDTAERVLLVGHNPGLQALALCLAADSDPLRPVIAEHYPTAALALIEPPATRWSNLQPGSGRVLDFLRPRDITESKAHPE